MAEEMLHHAVPHVRATWPRSAALLARQALEMSLLDDVHAPDAGVAVHGEALTAQIVDQLLLSLSGAASR